MKKKVIFFDVETNGVDPSCSVLSMSALKAEYDTEEDTFIKLDIFDRYYFRNPGEEINLSAISVNGLTDEAISLRRNESNIKYPETFKEDLENFYSFCDGAEHFVAHNIRFDRSFLPFTLKYQFDTMLENVNILKIKNPIYNSYKWPKLFECANFYKVELDENNLHNSMYDVLIMARVMYKMLKNEKSKIKVHRFLCENISTNMR